MSRRISALGLALLVGLLGAVPLAAAPPYGKLSGVVMDPTGTPQMGATVWVDPEGVLSLGSIQLLTNERGLFASESLRPGIYSVRVTLAGFLPTIRRGIRIDANLTTILKIELDSVFSSLDRLRRRPNQQVEPEDWMWVLRTSSATRPVLRYAEGEVVAGQEKPKSELAEQRKPHGRVEMTVGARRPGSASNLADAPSTAFAYEQGIGNISRLLLAGQVSYERSAAAGIAAVWLPSGELGKGSQTTLVLRQSNLGPAGPAFRGIRLQHTNQVELGQRLSVRFGAEYILAGLGASTSALWPRGELTYRFAPQWRASATVAARPWTSLGLPRNPMVGVVAELDAFPTVLMRDGRPVLEGGWHEEIALERLFRPNTSLTIAAFHDHARHTAVFGRGTTSDPEFFQDFFSDAFAYDGGATSSWGTRISFRQKFSDQLETAVVYAWAGALAPGELTEGAELRDALETRNRHSLAARVSTRLPKVGTQVAASYKWIHGAVVSRQDPFGEIAFQLDPNLNLTVRQPLPMFFFPGRFEALADFSNMLAQGYIAVNTRDGRLVLVPAFRSIRGGLSFQF